MNEIRKQMIRETIMKHNGVMKTSELYEECNLSYFLLDSLVKKGFLKRVKSGYYSLEEDERSEDEKVAALFPDAVLCLDSAIYFHGYTKKKPFAWNLAVDKNTSKSRFLLDYPVVVPHYMEERVLYIGAQDIKLGDCTMKIYDKDRMICDVLKYESKIDREVFKDALRGYINDKDKNIENLLSYARERKVIAKVQNTIGVWIS